MKMVQMDSLNFSDNFSYINYLIWSYGWISMIFWSLDFFSGISWIISNPENHLLRQHYVRVTSVVNGAGPSQTWRDADALIQLLELFLFRKYFKSRKN